MYPACQQAGLLLTAATRALTAAQHFELSEIHKYLDWINVMTYDFYGGGFSKIAKLNAPIVDCHSRQCGKPADISAGIQEYISAGVPPSKLVMGLATYGRSFRLSTPAGTGPPPLPGTVSGTGPGPAGACTLDEEGGVLAWYEIKQLGITPAIDESGMGAYATYGPNNEYWIGFDTQDTLRSKVWAHCVICWQLYAAICAIMPYTRNMRVYGCQPL